MNKEERGLNYLLRQISEEKLFYLFMKTFK